MNESLNGIMLIFEEKNEKPRHTFCSFRFAYYDDVIVMKLTGCSELNSPRNGFFVYGKLTE